MRPTVTVAGQPPIQVDGTPVRVQVDPPPVFIDATPVDVYVDPPPVRVHVDTPAQPRDRLILDCPDPTLAHYVGGVGFAPPPATVVDTPIVSAGAPLEAIEELPAIEERRTRAHLALDVGPTRIRGVDGRIFRTSFDGRVQFRRSFDLDLAYAMLVDGETALGLGRVGGSVRLIDGTSGFVRAGGSYVRLRDSEGVVHGAELSFGFGAEGGRLSTLFDASVGRLGASWTLAVRWTVGILLTRGLELLFGVDHTSLIPVEEPSVPVRFTTPTFGLRVLL